MLQIVSKRPGRKGYFRPLIDVFCIGFFCCFTFLSMKEVVPFQLKLWSIMIALKLYTYAILTKTAFVVYVVSEKSPFSCQSVILPHISHWFNPFKVIFLSKVICKCKFTNQVSI